MQEISQVEFDQARRLVDQGDVEQLRRFIETRPALCASRNDDETAPTFDNSILLYATSWPGGRPNGAVIVKLLLEFNADPMLRFQGTGETVLHWSASIEKDIDIVEVLLDNGAKVDALGGVICGGTALMNALYFGFVETADLLLNKGAFVDNIVSAAGLGRIDLLEPWHQGRGLYLKDATRLTPQSPSYGDERLGESATRGWTYRAVICALVCEQFHIVDWFIDNGFDIDLIPDDAGWSCLHHAAYWGSLPMAMYLVSKGANLHVREENNVTPADYGAAHGHPEVMNYLIDQGTTISLESAASKGRLDLVMQGDAQCVDTAGLLVQTIGTATDIGKPVHASIKHGRRAVAKYLLQKNPDLLHQLVDGKSALRVAEEKNDQCWLSSIRGC